MKTRILLANPSDSRSYALQMYPRSLERAALLSEIEHRQEWAHETARSLWDEERTKTEDEWKRGKERIRERLLEGLEERRKKAREEMASDGQLAGESSPARHTRGSCFVYSPHPQTRQRSSHRRRRRTPKGRTSRPCLSYQLHILSEQQEKRWSRRSRFL